MPRKATALYIFSAILFVVAFGLAIENAYGKPPKPASQSQLVKLERRVARAEARLAVAEARLRQRATDDKNQDAMLLHLGGIIDDLNPVALRLRAQMEQLRSCFQKLTPVGVAANERTLVVVPAEFALFYVWHVQPQCWLLQDEREGWSVPDPPGQVTDQPAP